MRDGAIDHASVDWPTSSPTYPIRRRPCADPVQKQVPGGWMTQKGIDSSTPVTEARMERSEMRGQRGTDLGFCCAPSGLRELRRDALYAPAPSPLKYRGTT